MRALLLLLLTSLPVVARRDRPWGYLAGRFVWRHRKGLALAGAAFVLLVVTSVMTTLSYWRADVARQEAEARFADARGAANTMLHTTLPRLARMPGTLPLRTETAAAAQAYLDRLVASPDSPEAPVEEVRQAQADYHQFRHPKAEAVNADS